MRESNRRTRKRIPLNAFFLFIGSMVVVIGLIVGLSLGFTLGRNNVMDVMEPQMTNSPIVPRNPSCFDPDFTCPTNVSLVATDFPYTSSSSQRCIVFNPDNNLLYVIISNIATSVMQTWSETTGLSANILPGGVFPGFVFTKTFRGCAYSGEQGKIFVLTQESGPVFRMISIELDTGFVTSLYTVPLGSTITNFIITPDDRFMVIHSSGNVYSINPTNGTILNTYSLPGVALVNIDYSTNRTVWLNDAGSGTAFRYNLFNIDIETGTTFPSCLSFRVGGTLQHFAFDSSGTLYYTINLFPFLYAIKGTPMYRPKPGFDFNFTGANFTLTCPIAYTGFTDVNISNVPGPTFDPIGCNGDPVQLIQSDLISTVQTFPSTFTGHYKRQVEEEALAVGIPILQEIMLTPIILHDNITYSEENAGKRSAYTFPGGGIEFYRVTPASVGQYAPTQTTILPRSIAASATQWVHIMQNPNTATNLVGWYLTTTFTLSQLTPPPCNGALGEFVIRFDVEAQRWVIIWVAGSSNICFLLSNTIDPLGTYTHTAYNFAGQNIRDLQFSVWGDYYLTTWNNVNLLGALGDSKCNVWERDRFINGGGMPRVLQVPSPSIVSTDGYRATSSPLHQPPNNGPRSPVQQSFPCGIFVAMTANSGGVLNMRMCQSINFDTSMVTTLDSRTDIGTYNDGASGTCVSETSCVTCGTSVKINPHRYYTATAYRSFPAKNYEKLAVAITIDSDGTSVEKIRWGEFFMNTDGSLSGGPMYVFEDDSISIAPVPVFLPSLLYDVTDTLVMVYFKPGFDFFHQLNHYISFRFSTSPPGKFSVQTNYPPPQTESLCMTEVLFPVSIASIVNLTARIITTGQAQAQTFLGGAQTRIFTMYDLLHTIRHYAVDACCYFSYCDQTVSLSWDNFILPQP